MKSIPYGRQHITQQDVDAVIEVLHSDFLTQGPKIEELEQKFASYIGARFALAVSNGTAALHLCALALQVDKGSKVITTPLTFVASANCIKYCGGQVFFADIDPQTYLLDIHKVRKLIESKPRGFFSGIVPVDFAGKAVNIEQYRQLADEYGLWIIEDACHAPGGYFTDSTGEKQLCGNGNFADLAIFSFHPVKHIATGEGGMITTNDETLYKKLLLLRTHGITKNPDLLIENHGGWYYEMQDLGYNYRLTDFQAALGISQLQRAHDGLQRRKEIARKYDEAFSGKAIKTPQADSGHAYHLYVIEVEDRLGLYNHLRANQIFAQVHYIPVHLQPYYKQLGHKAGDFPLVEQYYNHCLSIPMFPSLTDEEQQYVIDTIIHYIDTHP
jgi:UDP-4-amino-4,6-dideoxy-N-acetyl-beta-L-altrosamine transaminase